MIKYEISDDRFEIIVSFLKLSDNRTLVFGCNYKGDLCILDLITKHYYFIHNEEEGNIYHLMSINDNSFMSKVINKPTTIWKY